MVRTLALEADTAISNLSITEQNYCRSVVARNIKILVGNNKYEEQRRMETKNKKAKWK